MSQMDKLRIGTLAKASGWFTLAEAAEKLSIILNEDITESGVLRLVLAESLKLSINLPPSTPAKFASVVAIADESKESDIPKHLILPAPKDAFYLKIEEGNRCKYINGIFDLPMWFGDREAVEDERCRKDSGKDRQSDTSPIIVENGGQYYCLQDVIYSIHDFPKEYGVKPWKRFSSTGNSKTLPPHASFVIRLEALKHYEESINLTNLSTEKPLVQNERTTLLIIIDVLLKELNMKPETKSLAKKIAGLTVDNETPVSEDAIKNALNKIPDALLRRKK